MRATFLRLVQSLVRPINLAVESFLTFFDPAIQKYLQQKKAQEDLRKIQIKLEAEQNKRIRAINEKIEAQVSQNELLDVFVTIKSYKTTDISPSTAQILFSKLYE